MICNLLVHELTTSRLYRGIRSNSSLKSVCVSAFNSDESMVNMSNPSSESKLTMSCLSVTYRLWHRPTISHCPLRLHSTIEDKLLNFHQISVIQQVTNAPDWLSPQSVWFGWGHAVLTHLSRSCHPHDNSTIRRLPLSWLGADWIFLPPLTGDRAMASTVAAHEIQCVHIGCARTPLVITSLWVYVWFLGIQGFAYSCVGSPSVLFRYNWFFFYIKWYNRINLCCHGSTLIMMYMTWMLLKLWR